jgi:hypothetical protein
MDAEAKETATEAAEDWMFSSSETVTNPAPAMQEAA